jgi:mRNA interferase MazF
MKVIERGEIWVAQDKGYASKPRPVLVVQQSDTAKSETIVVSLITSADDYEDSGLRYFVPATPQNGLIHDSYVMIDKLWAINKNNFSQKMGEITDEQLLAVDKLIIRMLGIQ